MNLLGPIRLLYTFVPFLAKKEAATVINVSSGLGFVPLPATPTYSATKAAIHAFTECLRIQLAYTSIQVLELIPPGVRTTLMGQQDDEGAMPMEDFLSEVMTILGSEPDTEQIVVDAARGFRYAAADGTLRQDARPAQSPPRRITSRTGHHHHRRRHPRRPDQRETRI